MNKALLFTLLISCPTLPTTQLTPQQELAIQQQKDAQELKIKLIATFGTLALAAIAAYVQVCLNANK